MSLLSKIKTLSGQTPSRGGWGDLLGPYSRKRLISKLMVEYTFPRFQAEQAIAAAASGRVYEIPEFLRVVPYPRAPGYYGMSYYQEVRRNPSDPCIKCGGTGHIRPYIHIDRGICYRCEGTGEDPGTPWGKGEVDLPPREEIPFSYKPIFLRGVKFRIYRSTTWPKGQYRLVPEGLHEDWENQGLDFRVERKKIIVDPATTDTTRRSLMTITEAKDIALADYGDAEALQRLIRNWGRVVKTIQQDLQMSLK